MPATTTTKITKKRFEEAVYSREMLSPAVDSLAKIDVRALDVFGGGDHLIDQVTECLSLLQDTLAIAVAIVEKGQEQFDNRDQALFSAASSRYMQIDGDIEATKHQQKALTDTYNQKIEELLKKNFSRDEAERIVENPSDEVIALNTVATELKAEKQKIARYLADAPCYDESILAGTSVFALRDTRQALKDMRVPR